MNKTVVLVVEDDRPIRNLIVTTLKMHDYKYLTAKNGASAIMEASSHHPSTSTPARVHTHQMLA